MAEAYAILSGREITVMHSIQHRICIPAQPVHGKQCCTVAGTPISDWQSRHPRGNTRGWSATRPAARFSNAGLALFLCIPLVLTGITLGQ